MTKNDRENVLKQQRGDGDMDKIRELLSDPTLTENDLCGVVLGHRVEQPTARKPWRAKDRHRQASQKARQIA